jgi:hypothetical protein
VSSSYSEKCSTLKPLNISSEKSLILSYDTLVTNERYYNSSGLDSSWNLNPSVIEGLNALMPSLRFQVLKCLVTVIGYQI